MNDTMKELENIKHVTVWDDGDTSIETNGVLYPNGFVESETVEVNGVTSLDREYIIKKDDSELNVCPDCHEYVLVDGNCCDPSCTYNAHEE